MRNVWEVPKELRALSIKLFIKHTLRELIRGKLKGDPTDGIFLKHLQRVDHERRLRQLALARAYVDDKSPDVDNDLWLLSYNTSVLLVLQEGHFNLQQMTHRVWHVYQTRVDGITSAHVQMALKDALEKNDANFLHRLVGLKDE